MPRVAVQIAAYKCSKDFPRVIQSLKDQTYTDWSVYVYENSCDAEEAKRIEKILQDSGVTYDLVIGPKNTGFSAHNHLFVRHESEFPLVLNDDAYLDPRFIERLVTVMDADSKIGAAAGMVFRWTTAEDEVLSDATLIDTAGLTYHSLAHVVDRGAGDAWGKYKDVIQPEERVWGVSGAVAMYRRSALLDVATAPYIYDPSFFMYKEDFELTIRLKRKGYTSVLVKDAHAFHRRAIKPDHKGIGARISDERRRPQHLRIIMYRNQWMIYFYHATLAMGGGDFFASAWFEFKRSIFAFLVSPSVFLQAWWRIVQDAGTALQHRHALKEKGLTFISYDHLS